MSSLARFVDAATEEFGAVISDRLKIECLKSWAAAAEIIQPDDLEQAEKIHHGAFFAGVAMAQEEYRDV